MDEPDESDFEEPELSDLEESDLDESDFVWVASFDSLPESPLAAPAESPPPPRLRP